MLEAAATTDVCRRLLPGVIVVSCRPQVRVYLRCHIPVTCCLAASETPDGDRSWHVEGAGAGALVVQSPLFVLQLGAPALITACLADAQRCGPPATQNLCDAFIEPHRELRLRLNPIAERLRSQPGPCALKVTWFCNLILPQSCPSFSSSPILRSAQNRPPHPSACKGGRGIMPALQLPLSLR